MPRLLYIATVAITIKGVRTPYARHFQHLGWQVDGMAKGLEDSQRSPEPFHALWNIEWSRSPFDHKNLTAALRTVQSVVQQGKYDIVHVHTPIAGFVTRLAISRLPRASRPIVIYGAHGFHFYPGGPKLKNRIYLQLEKLAGKWTDYLVVVNRTDEQAAIRYGIVPASRVRYVPGSGIDLEHCHPDCVPADDVQAIRQELGLKPETPLFSMIAEFNPGKRHRDALLGFERAAEKGAHLAFAGSGPTMQEIRTLAIQKGIADRVHFLGTRPDVRALMRASIATVLPSEREGLPRSIIESMALERPVIGTAIRGITDLLGQGRGMLVEVGDSAGIRDAMLRILTSPEENVAMARQARQFIGQFDIHHLLRLHEQLYAEVLRGSQCINAA